MRRPCGHLQAVGVDAAGRLQYIYHEQWRKRGDGEKFDRVLQFAQRLPKLRRQVAADLSRLDGGQPNGDCVLAGAARPLDLGTFRIGNREYADDHDTYGLTTLERRHVCIKGSQVRFSYIAKYLTGQSPISSSGTSPSTGDRCRIASPIGALYTSSLPNQSAG